MTLLKAYKSNALPPNSFDTRHVMCILKHMIASKQFLPKSSHLTWRRMEAQDAPMPTELVSIHENVVIYMLGA